MKTTLFAAALLLSPLGAGAALADDDCQTAVSQWQPREAALAMAKDFGWQVNRVKVDDGCYEVKGRDSDGNRMEAKLDPGSLALVAVEIKFRPGADPARYVPGARAQQAGPAQSVTPPANGLFDKGAKPSVVVQ
tara:strand:- start:80 stop:481 length:402 start_codon:yes stop_codon:yes gene_type:complete